MLQSIMSVFLDIVQVIRHCVFPLLNLLCVLPWWAPEGLRTEKVDEHSSRHHDGLPERHPLELSKMDLVDEHSSCHHDGLPERRPLELRKMEWVDQHTSRLRDGLPETYAVELRKVE